MSFSWAFVNSTSGYNLKKVAADSFITNGLRPGTYSGGTFTWYANQFAGRPSWDIGGSVLVPLADGRLLYAGGYDGASTYIDNCAIGTITAGVISWVNVTPMPVANGGLVGALLADGRVMLWNGGNDSTVLFGTISGDTISWASGSTLPDTLSSPPPTLLPDGRILVMENNFTTSMQLALITVSGTTTSVVTCDTPILENSWECALCKIASNKILLSRGTSRGTSTTYLDTWVGTISGSTIAWAVDTPLPLDAGLGAAQSAVQVSDGTIILATDSGEGTYKTAYTPSADPNMVTHLVSAPSISGRLTGYANVQLVSESSITADLTSYQAPAAVLRTALTSKSTITGALTTGISLSTDLTTAAKITAAIFARIGFATALHTESLLTAGLSTGIPLITNLSTRPNAVAALTTSIQLETALYSYATLRGRIRVPIPELLDTFYVYDEPDRIYICGL